MQTSSQPFSASSPLGGSRSPGSCFSRSILARPRPALGLGLPVRHAGSSHISVTLSSGQEILPGQGPLLEAFHSTRLYLISLGHAATCIPVVPVFSAPTEPSRSAGRGIGSTQKHGPDAYRREPTRIAMFWSQPGGPLQDTWTLRHLTMRLLPRVEC